MLQPLSGKLTDIYGRRAGLIFCNVLFCAGSLICGLGQSEATIILGRVVAGLGGGGLNAIPLRRWGVWQGFNNICFGVESGLGGIFGGWLNDILGWRSAFLILVPLTIISGLLAAILVNLPTKETNESPDDKWKRVDVVGSLVSATAIILLLVRLNSGGNTVPWNHPLIYVSIALSLICFGVFGYVETVAIEPVIPVRLLLDRTVLSACLTSWVFSMAQIALTLYAPIFFQVQGKSAKTAGLLLIPTSVGAAVGGIRNWHSHSGIGNLLSSQHSRAGLLPPSSRSGNEIRSPHANHIPYHLLFLHRTGLCREVDCNNNRAHRRSRAKAPSCCDIHVLRLPRHRKQYRNRDLLPHFPKHSAAPIVGDIRTRKGSSYNHWGDKEKLEGDQVFTDKSRDAARSRCVS